MHTKNHFYIIFLLIGILNASPTIADSLLPPHNYFKVKICGLVDFNFSSRSQAKHYDENYFYMYPNQYLTRNMSPNVHSYKLYSRSQTYINAESNSEYGFKYGLNLVLNLTSDMDNFFNDRGFNRSYIYFEHDNTGRLELGGNELVSRSMSIDPNKLSVANDENSDTIFYDYVSIIPSGARAVVHYYLLHDYVIFTPQTYMNRHPIYFNTRKISYYTPVLNNFQLGFSYVPDTTNHGDGNSTNNVGSYGALMKNAISVGLNYNINFAQDLDVGLAAVMDWAKFNPNNPYSPPNGKRNIRSYNLGTKLKYRDITMMANSGSDGQSSQHPKNEKFTQRYYSWGVALDKDQIRMSAVYFKGKAGGKETGFNRDTGIITTSMLSLGVGYNFVAGLMPYLESNFYRIKYSQNENYPINNNGNVFLLGAKLVF